jgi:transposase
MINRRQYNQLVYEYNQRANMSQSAMKACVSRHTAKKYLLAGQGPDELRKEHHWRTRLDPFAEVWAEVMVMLERAPELEAGIIFEVLQEKYPGRFKAGQQRTLQRRVRRWRLAHGPEKEVYFSQVPQPGRRLQMDWTHMNSLGITVGGCPFPHLLCHAVLPYSNWQWGTRCLSESTLSLRNGLQQGLSNLGKVTAELWIDNSSSATQPLPTKEGARGFTAEFLDICKHFGMQPHCINVACPHENGDVESLHGHLRNRVEQYLMLRGSKDFTRVEDYDAFLCQMFRRANARVADKLSEELQQMHELPPTPLTDYLETDCRVSCGSTIRVRKVVYSVPSRLIGARVRVRLWEHQLSLYDGRELLVTLPRRPGEGRVQIDYRHVIGYLVRKPGAFAQDRWRGHLFPTVEFQLAYEQMERKQGTAWAEREYLHILKLAADHGQDLIGGALADLMSDPKGVINLTEIKALLESFQDLARAARERPPLIPDLQSYDALLEEVEVSNDI